MVGEGAARAWTRAVQPVAAFSFIACPGAMMRATVSFTPSTVSSPELHGMVLSLVQLGFITNVLIAALEGHDQPEAMTYQSGSPAASRNFSAPSVRQGNRPIAGNEQ